MVLVETFADLEKTRLTPSCNSRNGERLVGCGDTTMREPIDRDRRRLCSTAAMTIAAAGLGSTSIVEADTARPGPLPPIKPGTNASFASLKQIGAGLLNVGYAEAGRVDGAPVVLLHGWPYGIHPYVD